MSAKLRLEKIGLYQVKKEKEEAENEENVQNLFHVSTILAEKRRKVKPGDAEVKFSG